ncbi:MAG: CHAD domain-containing protein, partial [Acidimicrobiia bacterium]
VVARLRGAGAGESDGISKIVRALGPAAQAPPDLAPAVFSRDATVAEAVRGAIAAAAVRITTHDAGVRTGEDPEDVHQARVGTRRLRSDLRTLGPLLDPGWVDHLRAEAGWFADQLGVVRDAEVLAERLEREARKLAPEDAEGVAGLCARLADDREAGRARLLEAMNTPRYLALLETLVSAATAPVFAAPGVDSPTGADGGHPRPGTDPARWAAAEALPPLVRKPWRKLRRAVEALGAEPSDAELHRVRILAKRARYAAEAAAPVMGRQASAFAGAVARLQTVLGDHQDACVAETWLRRHVPAARPAEAMLVGQLIGLQRAEAAQCRAAWPAVWKAARKKSLRDWMR